MTKPTKEELRVLAAAFFEVRVGELLPHLDEVISNARISRTEYRARCPICHGDGAFSFKQGKRGIAGLCLNGCGMQQVAAAIVQRRLDSGEHPENLWGRADRLLKGEQWNP